MTPPADLMIPLHVTPAGEDLPPIWFLTPEGFFALPLAATPDERIEGARSFVRELYSRGDESVWAPAAPYYAAIAELMGATGVSYAAIGLFSTAEDDGLEGEVTRHEPSEGVAQCALTVAISPTDQAVPDPDVIAQGTLAALSSDPFNNAIWLDLPCGPAVSCITLREYTLSPEVTADGEEMKLLTGQIQVHVPFPTAPFTAIFTLHTASMEHWAEMYHMLSTVLQTISFTDPIDEME